MLEQLAADIATKTLHVFAGERERATAFLRCPEAQAAVVAAARTVR